ncbi:MAG: spore maturation protein [Clostridiales bacterium]|nr:spore maturation protein [Clostridiales bacterium]
MYILFIKFSEFVLPVFLLIVFLHAFYKKIPVYDVFVDGAKEGFGLAVKLIPYVVGIYVAVGMFRQSGAMELAIASLEPILSMIGIPGEIIPLLIVRPLSGPAALGMTVEILDKFGPDSFIGRLASTIDGSTDTTLYIIAVYFASVGVKKARYALPVGLLADFAGFGAAIFMGIC